LSAKVTDPADSRQLDSLLRRHRIELKHGLGQNFLTDPDIRDAVAEAAGLTPDEEVLEVGAGVGTLTVALAPRARRLVAVELDGRLIPALRESLTGHENVEVVRTDILRFNVRSAFPNGNEIVAGNIPYNLTGALIRKLLDDPPRPRRLSLVVQKEVAERWTAESGASLSTVAVQVFAEATMVFTIPAAAFTPPPRVDSALVRLDVRERRPQTLSLGEWETLYKEFRSVGG
jgi:16S rRNA (adenine1518-N6/adenine1519-N6)-dimethyltransferase